MPDEDVLDIVETPEKPAVSKEQAETVTISKSEFARLQRERDESRESEKYWATRARGGNSNQAPPAEDEDPIETADLLPKPEAVTGAPEVDESIFQDPDKWLAAVAKGPAAIQTLVARATRSYVTAEQVADIAAKVARRTVDVERTKIGTDNKLMTAFPELADNQSELFRATADEYKLLVEFDPRATKTPATLFAAARAAKAKLAAAKGAKPARDEEDEDDIYERVESERRRRIAAQDGSRNGRGSRGEEADDSSMGPQAKQLAKMMGITDDEFLAEKKKTDALRRKR